MKLTPALKIPLTTSLSVALLATALPMSPAVASTEVTTSTTFSAQGIGIESSLQIAAKSFLEIQTKLTYWSTKSTH